MQVEVGRRQLELGGKYLAADLRESNDALADPAALLGRLDEDGYLLIRRLHDRNAVIAARRALLEMSTRDEELDPAAPMMDGVINPNLKTNPVRKEYTKAPLFRALVESPRVMGFFEHMLGGPIRTFDYKWLRYMGTGAGSTAHYDMVYMGRGTEKLYTCWTPLGDVKIADGPLCLCLGSNRFEKLKQTYGKMDVDRDLIAGGFSDDPVEIVDKFGGRWSTTEFQMGDAIIFGMHMLHASLKNMTNRFRISCDTRYQLASEPADERWIGAEPKAHQGYSDPTKKITSMEEARAKWGV